MADEQGAMVLPNANNYLAQVRTPSPQDQALMNRLRSSWVKTSSSRDQTNQEKET
jgi:hypothetical protein